MRNGIKAGLTALAIAVIWATPAVAGGGGYGGVCLEEVATPGESWVAVADNCFEPNAISVEAGDVIRWEARGYPAAHTVTFPKGPDSGPLGAESFGVRFNQPGSYSYVCTYHPGMTGGVEVTGGSMPGATFETLSQTGELLERFETPDAELAGGQPARQQMVISFDPLAASVILLLFLPVTFGATLRLAGFAGRQERRSRIRPQLPWRREPGAEEPKPERRR